MKKGRTLDAHGHDSRPLAGHGVVEAEVVPEVALMHVADEGVSASAAELDNALIDAGADDASCVFVRGKTRRSTWGSAKTNAVNARDPATFTSPVFSSVSVTGIFVKTRIAFSPFFTRQPRWFHALSVRTLT